MSRETIPRIHFYKMTGAGNDFILIDNRKGIIDADHCQDLVRNACRRRLSVGADGMILIENDPEVDFKWRFFNLDASEAEMCGNAARCAARFAYLSGIVDKPRMTFRTLAGVIEAELLGKRVKAQMTFPHSLQLDLSLETNNRSLNLDFINTGVPHVVCFVADENELENADVQHLGNSVRFHRHFQPSGTNVNFACINDIHHISVRTYERGVEGETLACGTGAVASALISASRKFVGSPVHVRTRSGESLTIHFEMINGIRHSSDVEFTGVYLEGEARIAYEADLWSETV
jgi:diaminopimelate epimerase